MGGGMLDLNASLTAAANATSGVNNRLGDFIVGGKKSQPPWLWPALAFIVLAGVVVLIVRR